MKECILLQYYIRDYKDEYILNNCIDSLIECKTNLDIILLSHSPVSETIQKKVKYFIYDSDDDLINFSDIYYNEIPFNTIKKFFVSEMMISPFLFVVDDLGYTFYKAVYDLYKFVVAFGYDYSYYFIGDFEINKNEIQEMFDISSSVRSSGKMGYFEYLKGGHANPFFWYVNNKWFLENCFPPLNNKKDFLSYIKSNQDIRLDCCYESVLKTILSGVESSIIFEKPTGEKYIRFIDQSRVDMSKKLNKNSYDHDIGIFYINGLPNIFCFDDREIKSQFSLYLEYDNGEIDKYNMLVSENNNWSMFEIIIRYNSFKIKCVYSDTNKVKYDIYINDLEKYKKIFCNKELTAHLTKRIFD